VPSVEVGFDLILAVAIISLLAIRRRARVEGRAEPPAVSFATGAVLGLVTALVAVLVVGWMVFPASQR
jgi:hypothetical protein